MFDLDAMLTPSQAARQAGVSRQLVHDWIGRSRLDRVDGKVRLGDVLDLEAETRKCGQPGAYRRKPRLLAAAR